ncbi:MAG TPA: carboxypeptidase-like regulatory domain-containing protein [Longimicrobium sp.]|jgi:hypothetical protein|uniref:carboxypeptidase-like regulatory domain-containing protein n=1 Tax=Longimicrobium sp. TaxID=2029185 RepID=UPI002ED9B68B
MRTRTLLLRRALLAASLFAAVPAFAQSVRGRVTEPGTGEPVSGAVVMLLDARGARVAATLTDAQGAFAVQAGGPGTYTLRAERVGYAEAVSPALPLVAGQAAQQALVMRPRQVTLEPLMVSAAQRACTIRPQAEAAVAWEELRKALEAAAVADARGSHTYRKRMFSRVRTLYSRRAYERREWTSPEFSAEPFHATPVHRLAQHGYVEDVGGDSLIFHAPDAHTLLSDEFLEQHCFRLREGRGVIGLEFAPTADRTLPDVRGVLWMDRQTARLRRLEYTYVNLPYENPDDRLGGELHFEQLPDGAWIVRSWIVSMPRLRREDDRMSVIAVAEQGGDIIDIRPRQQ